MFCSIIFSYKIGGEAGYLHGMDGIWGVLDLIPMEKKDWIGV